MNKLKQLWQQMRHEIKDPLVTFSPPVTPDPEATRALEQQWQNRQRELAGWQPTNGFLIDVDRT